MIRTCEHCLRTYDDAERSTLCAHPLIMSRSNLKQKDLALTLLGKEVCFAHQPDGPRHRIQSVGWSGMVTLSDMPGEFAPHLFVIAKGTEA